MIRKRGQAALEFLMTYGWAFLVMIAVIAGIVALDPLGAAQTNLNTCTISSPLSCSSNALQLSASGDLEFLLENVGSDTVTVTSLNISDDGSEDCMNSSDQELSPGETYTVQCTNSSNALTGSSVVEGDSYTFSLDSNYYVTRVGSSYTRLAEGQVKTTATS